jgi:tetratricopeptide (TPR) repeat protein
MFVRLFAALVVFFALVRVPALANAQGAQEAGDDDRLIATGIALRKEGRDAEALEAFERAQALHPSPRALAQIALAHQALKRWREAERGLLDALSRADDPWIARHSVYLNASVAAVQTHLGWLAVDCNVEGAELWVGGELAGRLPLAAPLRVTIGALEVEVRAPGYVTSARTLSIEAAAKLHESFALAEVPPPPVQSSPALVEQKPAKPAPVGEPTTRASSGKRTAAWITLAGAAVLLGGGIAMQVLREHEVALYNDDSVCYRGPGPRDDYCGSDRDAANTYTIAAIVLYAGSAAAGLASGYLFLKRPSPASRPAAARVSCGFVGLGATCGGVF